MPLLSDLPINQSVGYFKLAGAEIIDDVSQNHMSGFSIPLLNQ